LKIVCTSSGEGACNSINLSTASRNEDCGVEEIDIFLMFEFAHSKQKGLISSDFVNTAENTLYANYYFRFGTMQSSDDDKVRMIFVFLLFFFHSSPNSHSHFTSPMKSFHCHHNQKSSSLEFASFASQFVFGDFLSYEA
jgi:hypothetical protein